VGGLLSFSGCCISSTRYLVCNRKYRQRFVLGQQHVHVNKLAVTTMATERLLRSISCDV
jgi:hypothetical protein